MIILCEMSRSDDTLLTVDFNLRAKITTPSPQVPQGRGSAGKPCD